MRIQELREQRASRVAEMQGLVAGAESAKRDLDGNEATRFDSLKAEVRGLEGQIARAELWLTWSADPMASRSLGTAGSPTSNAATRSERPWLSGWSTGGFRAPKASTPGSTAPAVRAALRLL